MKRDVFVRSAFNYDMDEASNEAGLACPPEESKTQQSFKEECDINEIVRRFGLTGELPDDFRPPMVGDFTEVMDYKSALNAVIAADEAFMQMPGELRARFDNDPQKLLVFLEDGKNRDEAVKLGLLNPAAPPPADVAPAPVAKA